MIRSPSTSSGVTSRVRQSIRSFGMDTITLAGPLSAKLDAISEAGFSQVMLKANDLVGHPSGFEAAVAEFKASGLRGTGFKCCATSRDSLAIYTPTKWTLPSQC